MTLQMAPGGHWLGYVVAVVSGGFTVFTDRLKADLPLDAAYANELEVVDGRFTGELLGEIVDREAKARLLRSIATEQGLRGQHAVAPGRGDRVFFFSRWLTPRKSRSMPMSK